MPRWLTFRIPCQPPLIARFMERTLGRQDPGGPHVGPMNLVIWGALDAYLICLEEIHCSKSSGVTFNTLSYFHRLLFLLQIRFCNTLCRLHPCLELYYNTYLSHCLICFLRMYFHKRKLDGVGVPRWAWLRRNDSGMTLYVAGLLALVPVDDKPFWVRTLKHQRTIAKIIFIYFMLSYISLLNHHISPHLYSEFQHICMKKEWSLILSCTPRQITQLAKIQQNIRQPDMPHSLKYGESMTRSFQFINQLFSLHCFIGKVYGCYCLLSDLQQHSTVSFNHIPFDNLWKDLLVVKMSRGWHQSSCILV